jgi:PhzF family phenazine biosynthesis protein
MLGLDADALGDEPRWISTGVEQLVIPVRSPEHVASARPVPALLERWGYSETRKEAMAYLVAESKPRWIVRFFFTSQGAVLEDPATGSACANLGGWLLQRGRAPLSIELEQGEAVGRPSLLHLDIDARGGIFVGGAVVELGRGTLAL